MSQPDPYEPPLNASAARTIVEPTTLSGARIVRRAAAIALLVVVATNLAMFRISGSSDLGDLFLVNHMANLGLAGLGVLSCLFVRALARGASITPYVFAAVVAPLFANSCGSLLNMLGNCCC